MTNPSGLAEMIEDAKRAIASWPPEVRRAVGIPDEPRGDVWDPVERGGPMPSSLRFDVVGWACSVCGAWLSEDEEFCAHPNRPVANRGEKHGD